MSDSPIESFLAAIDSCDPDAMVAHLAPDVRVLVADGRRAEGRDEARVVMTDFLSAIRSAHHEITNVWRADDVWIAEVNVTYELSDHHVLHELPRAFVVRHGSAGISELRVYGAQEHPLDEHLRHDEAMRIGGRPFLPL